MNIKIALTLVAALIVGNVQAEDWLSFRNGSGFAQANLPVKFSAKENIAWEKKLPGKGVSSPIVVDGKVIVTASSGHDHRWMHVLCFDAESGKKNWERKYWATGRPYSHPQSSNAAPTPVSDGNKIFAFFSSNDMVCLDLDGNLVWFRGLSYDYPKAANDIGMASSPVVYKDKIVVQIENQGDSFAACLQTATGETAWKVERIAGSSWASPTIIPGQDGRPDMVSLQSRGIITGHNLETGATLWEMKGQVNTVASATYSDGVLYAPINGLTAIKFDKTGKAEKFWENGRLNPRNASPITTDAFLYVRGGNGVFYRAHKNSGKEVFRARVGGGHWATPIVTNSHAYIFDYDGKAFVLKLGEDSAEVVHETKLTETSFQGTPAVANNAIFVRSDDTLFKIAK